MIFLSLNLLCVYAPDSQVWLHFEKIDLWKMSQFSLRLIFTCLYLLIIYAQLSNVCRLSISWRSESDIIIFYFCYYYNFDYYYYYYVLFYTHSKDISKLATISNVFKVKLNNCLHLFDSRFCTKNAKYNFNLCKLIFYANSPLAMKSHFTKKVNSYKYLTWDLKFWVANLQL